MKLIKNFRESIVSFHRDERGESSAMANVMKLAIAAVVVIALVAFGNKFLKWMNDSGDQIMRDADQMGKPGK